jgi:hypothetical protein
VFRISEAASHGHSPSVGDGPLRAGTGGWGMPGAGAEVCGTLGVVRTRRAHPVVLVPAPGSCPYGERRGFRGKERAERRRGVLICGERRGDKEEGAAGTAFPYTCVMEEPRAFGCALPSGHPGTSICLAELRVFALVGCLLS